MTLGDYIKTYRVTNQCSMDEFAKKTGMSKAYISLLERNYNPTTKKPPIPSLETIMNVASVIGIDFDTLLSSIDRTPKNMPTAKGVASTDAISDCRKTDRITIGERIRILREQNDLTLDDVAKICGTSRQSIYKYENNIVTNIPCDRIISLCTALKVSPSTLLGWGENHTISLSGLSQEKRELIDMIKILSEEKSQLLLQLAKSFR